MKTTSQLFVVIMLSVLLLSSCSQKQEFVIEHKWQVEKIQKYPEAIYEKSAIALKKKNEQIKIRQMLLKI
mgnify:CR=1 FL=1